MTETSVVTVPPPSTPPAEIVLEGYMLKQGSRSRHFWHERYFTFSSDHTLKYYVNKEAVQDHPKNSYVLSELPDLQVSDLYVEQHQKEMVYCMKLTWSVWDESEDQPYHRRNNSSPTHFARQESNDDESSVSLLDVASRDMAAIGLPPPDSPPASPGKAKRMSAKSSFLRLRRRKTGEKIREGNNGIRSVDHESLTLGSRRHRRPSNRAADGEQIPHIPSLVEVDQRQSFKGETSGTGSPPRSAKRIENTTDDDVPVNSTSRTPRTPYEKQREEDLEYLRSQFLTMQKETKKRHKQRLRQGTGIALATGAAVGLTVVTAGVGLVAGLVLLGIGAAAGGGGAAVQATWKKKITGEIVLANVSYETARVWKACLDASRDSDSIKNSKWGRLFVSDGRKTDSALLPRMLMFSQEKIAHSKLPTSESRDHSPFDFTANWRPLEGGWVTFLGGISQGLRIFREEKGDAAVLNQPRYNRSIFAIDPSDGTACPPMKAHVVLNASSLDAFLCLMSYGRITKSVPALAPNSEQRASFRVVESIDDHTDIIHLFFRPLYLFPSWTEPRDFVLFRYWRLEQDGSYIVCYESMPHLECPPLPGYVRGELHQVVTVAPQKRSYRRKHAGSTSSPAQECFVTAVAQVDPKGWVPTTPLPFLSNQGYGDAFAVATLSLMLEVRDAIDQDRFVSVCVDSQPDSGIYNSAGERRDDPSLVRNALESIEEPAEDTANYDFSYAAIESSRLLRTNAEIDLALNPAPYPAERWAEPDSNSFRVRGHAYKLDHVKINAGPSIGRLVAADVVTSDKPIYTGFSIHPTERVQLAMRKEAKLQRRGFKSDMPPFLFIVTIVLPGPPYYYGVYYFAVDDMRSIDGTDGTPSSRLCKEFFFGDDDEFRDRTFKMIPQIVQGNFIVRKAVGSTPAIMGKKLRQLYVKGSRFFEVILDCGSSSVATGVIRLCLGYSKSLVVDMGFLFEGYGETTLPEKIFGCVRMKNTDFGPHLRRVEAPALPVTPDL